MNTFKQSAIEVLKKTGKPLHYVEITRLALEAGLLETEGETPARTINAFISTDIKYKGSGSDFIRMGHGIYGLNPEKTEVKQTKKQVLKEQNEEQNIITLASYTGKAGEYLVCSELLFRNFNASIMGVDVGVDIAAVKENRFYGIQVKTAHKNDVGTYPFYIRKVSFDRHNLDNVFYVFVMKKDKKADFIIMSAKDIAKEIQQKTIYQVNNKTGYALSIGEKDGRYSLGNRDNGLESYVNNWEVIK